MSKKSWRKPEVKYIAAGSAENGPVKTNADVGTNNKS